MWNHLPSVLCMLHAGFLLCIMDNVEDGGNVFIQKGGLTFTRRLNTSQSPLWEPQILQSATYIGHGFHCLHSQVLLLRCLWVGGYCCYWSVCPSWHSRMGNNGTAAGNVSAMLFLAMVPQFLCSCALCGKWDTAPSTCRTSNCVLSCPALSTLRGDAPPSTPDLWAASGEPRCNQNACSFNMSSG